MTITNPSRIPGRWRDGYALDFHIVSSTYVGDDEFGHPTFDTKRTKLGDLLYRLKYRFDTSVVNEIAETAANFINSWKPPISLIVPVPASRPRAQQPVLLIAQALEARLRIPARPDAVRRAKNIPQLKNVYDYDTRVRLLQGAHIVDPAVTKEQGVLLLYDLFRSGATMNAIAEALYGTGSVSDVFGLTITRTRSRS